MTDYGEYRRIAIELVKGTPPQRLDYAIRARAERMAVDADNEALWAWAKANTREIDYVLEDHGMGSLLGLFRGTLKRVHQDQLKRAVRYEQADEEGG